jgi:hypothetical protein
VTVQPDAALAVQHLERAIAADRDANVLHALADAWGNRQDRDDLDGDCRREVRRLLEAAAGRVEQHAEDCRERAHDAQQLRRHRYDSDERRAADLAALREKLLTDAERDASRLDCPSDDHDNAVCDFVHGGAA